VIADMIRKFPEVETTLLFGNLDHIKYTPFGRMIIGLKGETAQVQAALDYFKTRELKEEVIGYVKRHDSTSD
jgi:D-methionine transport system ATP-binding protein